MDEMLTNETSDISNQEIRDLLDEIEIENPDLLNRLIEEARVTTIPYLDSTRDRDSPDEPEIIERIERVEDTEKIIEYRRYLGSSKLPNEVRLHKHGRFDYRFETRTRHIKVFLKFKHPQLSDFLKDAIACSKISGIASVVAAVALGGNIAAGYTLFYPLWKRCMVVKVGERIVKDIKLTLESEKHVGNWTNH